MTFLAKKGHRVLAKKWDEKLCEPLFINSVNSVVKLPFLDIYFRGGNNVPY